MSRTDFIADNLTIIRNALMVKRQYVDIPFSNMTESILKILKKENYIEDFKTMEHARGRREEKKHRLLRVYLKYSEGSPLITNLKRVSRSSLRVYVKKDKIPRVLRGKGTAIISTSKGIMTDEEARLKKIGGEVICYVY